MGVNCSYLRINSPRVRINPDQPRVNPLRTRISLLPIPSRHRPCTSTILNESKSPPNENKTISLSIALIHHSPRNNIQPTREYFYSANKLSLITSKLKQPSTAYLLHKKIDQYRSTGRLAFYLFWIDCASIYVWSIYVEIAC